MTALLRDFGDPDLLSHYESRLKAEFLKLEERVGSLSAEKQSRIIATLTDHLLQGISSAQQEAEKELANTQEGGR
jgi:hypothetical protein